MSDHLDIAQAAFHDDTLAAERFARQHMHRMVDMAVAIAEQLGKEASRNTRPSNRRATG